MESLIHALSWVSTALQVPVVVGILYLLVRGLMMLGETYGRWGERLQRARRGAVAGDVRIDELLTALRPAGHRKPDVLQQSVDALCQAPGDQAWHDHVVARFELQIDRRLALLRTMTRIGPLLGLMGTLIPLGPALVALAAGDIAVLARKMEVAFATTVVGLVIGAIGFLLHQAAQRWALDDLSMLEFVSARLRGAQ
ncbi:MotA/TolQ/ExbB proton channel family protein [Roseateles sp.]|uniref:MotA/TolQ/ExbB proton channel family protein n=1 Tax=Roseateles sp. TaxID=1971397 RepID=UPI0025EEE816|nr:MotA/TolQ/ExbB proton channel family protein [Roseateles sp.]MBV8036123.1 MotA/TolQ/ExbB proton channel family protein [Roseateles sp.]